MRDPARIDRMLDLLREIWIANPDLRLAQIVVSALGPGEPVPRVFHAEDDRVEEGLRSMLGDSARE